MRRKVFALAVSLCTLATLSETDAAIADVSPRIFVISAPSTTFKVMLGNDDVSGNVYCAPDLSETEGRLTVLRVDSAVSLYGPASAARRDLLFVDEHRRIVVLSLNTRPHLTNGGPGETVSVLARYFIELAPGQASKLRLNVGDQLRLPQRLGDIMIPRPPCVREIR